MEGSQDIDKLKVCFIGHTYVGKTSIIKRFANNQFTEEIPSTQSLETTDVTAKAGDRQVMF